MDTMDSRQQTSTVANDRIIEEHRRLFNQKVEELVRDKQTNLLTKEEYEHIVYVLNEHGGINFKPRNLYNILQSYCLVPIGGKSVLVRNNSEFKSLKAADGSLPIEKLKRLCHVDEAFDVIRAAHLKLGHGGGRKTHIELKGYVSNISRLLCDTYRDLCTCNTFKKVSSRAEDIIPILSETFNSRGQVSVFTFHPMILHDSFD